jgi:hypothetical protein
LIEEGSIGRYFMGDLRGEEVIFDDLVEREGLLYKKFTDVPFTGKTTGQTQETYKDGVNAACTRHHGPMSATIKVLEAIPQIALIANIADFIDQKTSGKNYDNCKLIPK